MVNVWEKNMLRKVYGPVSDERVSKVKTNEEPVELLLIW
jgi:hypothetical protein